MVAMMTPSKSELASLQAGRGLAALSVVLFHLNGPIFGNPKYWGQEISPVLRSGYSGVEYFFVLSGFLMAYVHWSQLFRRNDPRDFLFKRFVRIYPAYWVSTAFVILVAAVVRTGIGDLSLLTIVKALTLWPTPSDPPLAVAWTLEREVVFYLFFAAFLWRPKIGGPIMAAWLISGLIGPFFRPAFPTSFFTSDLQILFALGMAGAIALRRGRIPWPAALATVGAIGFAAAWAFAPLRDQGAPFAQAIRWTFGLGATLMIVGFAQLERDDRIAVPAPLKILGDASYSIYLVHFPTLSIGAKVMFATGLGITLPRPVCIAAMLVCALLAGFAFRLLVEKPLIDLVARVRRSRLERPQAFEAKA